MVSKCDSEYHEEKSVKYACNIPIACGIFTFVYWFILTPILWSAMNMRPGSELFGVFMISMAVSWGVIMGFFMCVWWFKRRSGKRFKEKAAKARVSVVKKDSGDNVSNNSDSPPFPTKPQMVQPSDTPIPYSFKEMRTDSEKDVSISLNSCPVQVQGTPSLYNARTGRQSFELGYGDSSGSLPAPNAAQNSSDHVTGILTVKKSDSTGSVVCRRISSTDSEEEKEVLKEPSLRKNKAGHDRSITVETAVIEHNAQNVDVSDFSKEAAGDPQVPRLTSSDSFHGLPEMNSFDAYLHLTTVDTPMTPPTEGTSPKSAGLTPRQLFFSDLIKQAEENPTVPCLRRSVGDEVMTRQKATADNRKSMPLYLYFVNNPESHLSSSKPTSDVPAVAGYPVGNKDALSVTDVEDHGPSPPTQKVKHDDLQSNLNNTESEYDEPEDSADTKTGRDVTGGEFFIANVARTASVTSEVYLNIGGDAVTMMEPDTSMQWNLVVDDDNLSDDCVFEDDVSVMKKKK
jgi:hypothetical protein